MADQVGSFSPSEQFSVYSFRQSRFEIWGVLARWRAGPDVVLVIEVDVKTKAELHPTDTSLTRSTCNQQHPPRCFRRKQSNRLEPTGSSRACLEILETRAVDILFCYTPHYPSH